MKKLLVICALASTGFATNVLASDDNGLDRNPIVRSIVMNDGGFEATAIVGYHEDVNGDDGGLVLPGIRYGITDNLTVGIEGITYRFYQNDGLQLGVNAGIRDAYDTDEYGYSVAYGASVFGKKAFGENFALTFGVDFVNWDEEKLEDKDEIDYSIGAMFNLTPDWTLGVSYTYRDLDGFSQDHADEYGVSLSYRYSDDIDVGIFAMESNFDHSVNGFYQHETTKEAAGVFVNWRF